MNNKIKQFIALSKLFHLHESQFRLTGVDINSTSIAIQVINQAESNLIEIIKTHEPSTAYFKTDVTQKIADLTSKVIKELESILRVYESQIDNNKGVYLQDSVDAFQEKILNYRSLISQLSGNSSHNEINNEDRILTELKKAYVRIGDSAIPLTRSKYLINYTKSIVDNTISYCSESSIAEFYTCLDTIEISTNRRNFMKTLLDNIRLYVPLIISDKYSTEDFEWYRYSDKNGLLELTALETSDVLMKIYESLLKLECINDKEVCVLKSTIYTHDYNCLFDYEL